MTEDESPNARPRLFAAIVLALFCVSASAEAQVSRGTRSPWEENQRTKALDERRADDGKQPKGDEKKGREETTEAKTKQAVIARTAARRDEQRPRERTGGGGLDPGPNGKGVPCAAAEPISATPESVHARRDDGDVVIHVVFPFRPVETAWIGLRRMSAAETKGDRSELSYELVSCPRTSYDDSDAFADPEHRLLVRGSLSGAKVMEARLRPAKNSDILSGPLRIRVASRTAARSAEIPAASPECRVKIPVTAAKDAELLFGYDSGEGRGGKLRAFLRVAVAMPAPGWTAISLSDDGKGDFAAAGCPPVAGIEGSGSELSFVQDIGEAGNDKKEEIAYGGLVVRAGIGAIPVRGAPQKAK